VLSEFWSLSNYAKATPQNSKINELKKPITQELLGNNPQQSITYLFGMLIISSSF